VNLNKKDRKLLKIFELGNSFENYYQNKGAMIRAKLKTIGTVDVGAST